jgi:hypothetical protein
MLHVVFSVMKNNRPYTLSSTKRRPDICHSTLRVHPDREDSLGVRMRAHGSDAVLLSLDA